MTALKIKLDDVAEAVAAVKWDLIGTLADSLVGEAAGQITFEQFDSGLLPGGNEVRAEPLSGA